jgi:hypothetical protein
MSIKFYHRWDRKWSRILIRIPLNETENRKRVSNIKCKINQEFKSLIKELHG